MLEILTQFILASILLTLSPGPDILYVLVTGLSRGVKSGLLLSFGLVSGILVHTTLVAFGISALIKSSEILFFGIKLAGALYLLFLAFKIFKQPAQISVEPSKTNKKSTNFVKQGFLMNVLNPKVTLFFMAFLPQFLWDKSSDYVFQFYSLGFIFMAQAFLIFALIAIFSNRFYKLIQTNPKSAVVFKYLQIFVLSVYQLINLERLYFNKP